MWMQEYVALQVRPSTYRSYEAQIRNHIIPAPGAVRLDRLRPYQIQQFLQDKLDRGRADGRAGGLSNQSIQYLHMIMLSALQQAVTW